MDIKKVIVSGVSWSILLNIVSILYGIVSVPFLISYFGKTEYGLIGIAMSVNIYIQLMDMGMSSTNVKFFSEFLVKKDQLKTQHLFSTMHFLYFAIGLINSLLLLGISFFVADLFKVTIEQAIVLRNLMLILGLNAVFSWISACYDQFLQANNLLNWTRKRQTLLKVLQFIILLITIQLKLSIEIYFFLYIFMTTVILPLSIFKIGKIAPLIKKNFKFDKKIFKLVFPFAFSIFSFSIFQFLALNFRPLILGNIKGPDAVAEYNIMNTITLVVTVFTSSLIQVLIPVVTKVKALSDNSSINKIMLDGTKYVMILISFVVLLLILSIREILTLYVGEDFVYLYIWLSLWLLVLILSHRNVMTSMVFTENNLKSIVYMGSFAMVVAFVSYYIFIPQLGVGGVIIGFALHELIHTLFYYVYFLPKHCNINTWNIFKKSVFPILLIVLIELGSLYLFFNFVKLSVFGGIIIKSILASSVFLLICWISILNKKDKYHVRRLCAIIK